jgi:hypothetical protein
MPNAMLAWHFARRGLQVGFGRAKDEAWLQGRFADWQWTTDAVGKTVEVDIRMSHPLSDRMDDKAQGDAGATPEALIACVDLLVALDHFGARPRVAHSDDPERRTRRRGLCGFGRREPELAQV